MDTYNIPSLLQCDFSHNDIRTMGTVEAFARRSLSLVHLDITSNPLLLTSSWKVTSSPETGTAPYYRVIC